MGYRCPACKKIWPTTMDLARHMLGTGDKAHRDWISSQGYSYIELLLKQTMEPGNKGYKILSELLEKKAEKVD